MAVPAGPPPVDEIQLPAGALVLLVGVSGSGKTTFARTHFAADEVLSSDAYRARVAGSQADQSASPEAFRRLHVALANRMARGALTVVDATNVQAWARRELLDEAERARRPSVAIVLDLPLGEALARSRARAERRVPAWVIRRQSRDLRASLPRLPGEGYARVVILAGADAIARARVAREPHRSVVDESATSRA